MRKILGYIPLESSEDRETVAKETDVIKIQDQWFKLSEVFVPGVVNGVHELVNRMTFRPKEGEEKYSGNSCVNCGKTRSFHKGPNGYCPARDEKTLPGMKYD